MSDGGKAFEAAVTDMAILQVFARTSGDTPEEYMLKVGRGLMALQRASLPVETLPRLTSKEAGDIWASLRVECPSVSPRDAVFLSTCLESAYRRKAGLA